MTAVAENGQEAVNGQEAASGQEAMKIVRVDAAVDVGGAEVAAEVATRKMMSTHV
jgi:hypothetical protein